MYMGQNFKRYVVVRDLCIWNMDFSSVHTHQIMCESSKSIVGTTCACWKNPIMMSPLFRIMCGSPQLGFVSPPLAYGALFAA